MSDTSRGPGRWRASGGKFVPASCSGAPAPPPPPAPYGAAPGFTTVTYRVAAQAAGAGTLESRPAGSGDGDGQPRWPAPWRCAVGSVVGSDGIEQDAGHQPGPQVGVGVLHGLGQMSYEMGSALLVQSPVRVDDDETDSRIGRSTSERHRAATASVRAKTGAASRIRALRIAACPHAPPAPIYRALARCRTGGIPCLSG